MAIGGDFGWRPVGRFSWPPSRDAAKRGLRDARLPLLGHKTGPGPAARRADHRATPPSRSPPVRSWRADRSTPPGPSSGCRPAAPRSAHARPSGPGRDRVRPAHDFGIGRRLTAPAGTRSSRSATRSTSGCLPVLLPANLRWAGEPQPAHADLRTDPRPRRQADKDLHADRQSSLAELDPNLPTEIAKPSPLAQSWNEFDHALDAHIANAALTS